jgi:hypothetical protein
MLLLSSLPNANSGLPPTALTLRGLCDCGGDGQKRKAVEVSKKLVERKPVRWRSEPVGEQQGKPGESAIRSCLLLPSGRFQLFLPAGTIDEGSSHYDGFAQLLVLAPLGRPGPSRHRNAFTRRHLAFLGDPPSDDGQPATWHGTSDRVPRSSLLQRCRL